MSIRGQLVLSQRLKTEIWYTTLSTLIIAYSFRCDFTCFFHDVSLVKPDWESGSCGFPRLSITWANLRVKLDGTSCDRSKLCTHSSHIIYGRNVVLQATCTICRERNRVWSHCIVAKAECCQVHAVCGVYLLSYYIPTYVILQLTMLSLLGNSSMVAVRPDPSSLQRVSTLSLRCCPSTFTALWLQWTSGK